MFRRKKILHIFISLIGGLGLFLYGISVMGGGLQKSTGPKLEKAIGLLTSNVFVGVLVGAVVTGIIQSSGATTVMVVGFFMMSADSFAILLLALAMMTISVFKLKGIDLSEECESGLHFNRR